MGIVVTMQPIKYRMSKMLKGLWAPNTRPKYWNFADDSYYLPSEAELSSFLN